MKRFHVLAVSLVLLAACRAVDYAYRHRVAGIVADPSGKAVAGALVERIWPEAPGLQDESGLYRRTSAADGSFEFLYSGLGGKPQVLDAWNLAVSHERWGATNLAISIVWRPFSETNPDYGYVADRLMIILPGK